MSERDYLHGYLAEEQDRLLHQARYLEAMVHDGVDLRQSRKILEVGSGVGAQTAILLERNPKATLTCVDAEPAQIARAREHLAALASRVQFVEANAEQLNLPHASHDGAFLCWFLEHVKDPETILRKVHQTLTPGSPAYAIEVFNPVFRLHPAPKATLDYWRGFNELQFDLGGNPEIGLGLGTLFRKAGFRNVKQELLTWTYDARDLELRNSRLDYWFEILASALPAMRRAKRADAQTEAELRHDLALLKEDPFSTFLFGFVRVSAIA